MLLRKRPRTAANVAERAALFSPEAMSRAWQSVRHNGPTPGVDGVTLRQFTQRLDRNLEELRCELEAGVYEPLPVKRILIPKKDGGLRPLAIWALRDRIAQRVVHDALVPLLEPLFLECSYGFRPGRAVADAVRAITAARDLGYRWVVDADIEDCFGSLDYRRMMAQVRAHVHSDVLVKLIDKWLNTRVQNPASGRRTKAATSQGGVITPVLANLYLHPFDVEITRRVSGGRLVRFADDFVILCRKRQEAASALSVAEQVLRRLRLQLNPRKTQVVHFDEGFSYLGVFFLRNEHFTLNK